MKATRRQFGPLHIGFLAVIGVIGWVALLSLSVLRPPELRAWEVNLELVACMGLAATSRVLAFRVFRRVRVALDSAFYIAVAFLFGVVPAAWVVLVVLSTDAAVSMARDLGQVHRQDSPWWYAFVQIVHDGALPALVLLAVGILFRVDAWSVGDDLDAMVRLPLFAVCFLVVHYSLAGGTHWVQGTTSRVVIRGFFLRVVAAELVLVPLSLAMVLGYSHQGFGLFLLLGATCLLFNVLFRRAAITSESLHRRVEELATLNKVGRILSSSLERRTLMSNIATETVGLVRHASRFMIGIVDEASDMVVYELFDESGRNYKRLSAARDEGLSGWVMSHRQPLLLGNVQREYALYSKSDAYKDPRFHSWMGVPLEIYNEVVGIISVQSEQRYAYTRNHLRVMSMIADQAAVALENSRLYELATIDGLTALFVRRYFDQRLREEWLRSARYGSAFSVGLIDIDNFKRLNDTYGHQAGDQVLRSVAAVLRNNMRSFEIAARYGGEEFALILPRTSVSEALRVAERVRNDIEQMVIAVGGERLRVTVSVGLAAYPESGAEDEADLVSRADQALYQAKREGKNRVVVHGQVEAVARSAPGREAGLFAQGGAL